MDAGFGSEVVVFLGVATSVWTDWGGLLGTEGERRGALADASATVGEPSANAP
jgi:hypothetical protein